MNVLEEAWAGACIRCGFNLLEHAESQGITPSGSIPEDAVDAAWRLMPSDITDEEVRDALAAALTSLASTPEGRAYLRARGGVA